MQVQSATATTAALTSAASGGVSTPSGPLFAANDTWPGASATLAELHTPRTASAELATARTHAALAADVYNDVAAPPAGWRVASADELRGMGLRTDMLESGDFRARVYAEGSGADAQYVVAFRGTQSAGDWVQNVRQGFGFESGHYDRAMRIGEALATAGVDATLTGHSLGGGLASAAAIASGLDADTFNAAGLHRDTIAEAGQLAAKTGAGRPDVDAYYVRGEALSLLQDGGDRVIGPIILGPIVGSQVDVPPAYGDRHVLDAVTPEGKDWRNAINPVDRHGMDWVQSSLADRSTGGGGGW